MTIDVELKHRPGYLSVTVRGPLTLATARQIMQQTVTLAGRSEAPPMLFDARGAACSLSYADIVTLIADMDKHRAVFRRKIAIPCQKNGKADIAHFLELCAGNRGLWVQTFADAEAAVCWLVEANEPNTS